MNQDEFEESAGRLLNGQMDAEERERIQAALRESAELRRQWVRLANLDAGLRAIGSRDGGEDFTAVSTLERESPESIGSKILPMRPREKLAWLAAAACLALAIFAWSTRELEPAPIPVIAKPDAPKAPPTLAEQREQLLAMASDAIYLHLVNDGDASRDGASGDVVWSSDLQAGFLRIHGLAKNDSSESQYRLWIVDADYGRNYPIDGGSFDVDETTGELVVPILARDFVQRPKMFLISVGIPGGGQDPSGDEIPLYAEAPAFR